MKKSKITRQQIIVQLLLLTLIGLSACLFLSLFSYDPFDPGWSRTGWHYSITNFGGYIGAYASDILLQFLGLIAYTIPFIIILICLQLMLFFYRHAQETTNYFTLSFRIIGILGFIFSTTGFFALNIRDPEPFDAGGYLGSIVIESLLPVMDSFIISLVLFVTCLACITLLTGLTWLNLIERLGALVMILLTPFKWLFAALRKTKQINEQAIKQDKQIKQMPLVNQQDESQFTFPVANSNTAIPNGESSPITIKEQSPLEQSTYYADEILIQPIGATPEPSTATISLVNEPVLIKTTEELLQTIEDNKVQQPNIVNETLDKTTQDEVAPNNILPRMDPVFKTFNEQNIATTQEQPFTQNENIAIPFQLNKSTIEQPVELEEFTISDTPSKPMFTMINDEDEITINHNDNQTSFEPIIETSSTEIYEPLIKLAENKQFSATDTPSLSIEPEPLNQPVDIIHQDNTLADDNSDNQTIDNEDSLIHPLLRRNDKPLPKPTTPLPSLDLLTAPPTTRIEVDHVALNAMSQLIEKSLADYRVKAKVVDYMPGPVITRFEIELAPGIKAARISTLDRDLARSLSMPSVRVVEVIPGKPYVGIELPNKNRQTVYFREVLDSHQFRDAQSPLTVVLGKDIAGQSVVADLAKMPHLLVAGTTGSGKSVGVNAMILSILYKSQPEDVRFIMIDPKMLELSIYEGIPHLLTQVVTDMKDAANALNWCVNEMEKRYRLMSALGVRNIAGYNEKIRLADEMNRPIPDPLWKPTDSMDLDMPMLEKLPYIVVMVDEFADLIMAVGKKVEELIARLAQKARAAGIHLVLATQRPSVDVITGLIKANIPTRIAFTVSSKIDSRTILDQMGAESLLGMGDMLYLAPNSSIPIRVHGAFVRDEEVHAVVQDWKARGTPKYIENVTVATDDNNSNNSDTIDEELDPLFDQVVAFVVETRRASISSVQRKFRIGYNRAARIVEQMEVEGIISAPSHNGNREVLAQASHSDY